MEDPLVVHKRLLADYERVCAENAKLKEALKSMVYQYAGWSRGGLMTNGMSALEEAFEALGWKEPHKVEAMTCDEPGCDKQVSCGWPSKDGYRNTCGKHWRKD